MAQVQALQDYVDSQDASPFVSVTESMTDQTETPVSITTENATYALRIQSNRFHDDNTLYSSHQLKKLIKRDLSNRVAQIGADIAGIMFPDTAFGFPINDQFLHNFYESFLSSEGFDPANFNDEERTAAFLNRMISTVAHFLDATKQVSFKPLRYFTSANSNIPLKGHVIKRKPDIILDRLIDGYVPEGTLEWRNVQAIIEHTREKSRPQRMFDTVSSKSYLTFCTQPERDFLVCLCITGKGFHIVMTDHVGQVETDVIPFQIAGGSLIFVRMVMGLAFLPDSLIGIDSSFTRNEARKPSKIAFATLYQPFKYKNQNPSIVLLAPSSVTSTPTSTPMSSTPMSSEGISTISVGPIVYKVISVLFRSQTLIGRATKVFLVELPDGRTGVLKDSWITVDRPKEADFLQGLDIPFGPKLIDHCVLRNTETFRQLLSDNRRPLNYEIREKRRVVTYPAGVHISDFTSLWELIVAFLDIVIAILYLETKTKVHRDISYTNILLRERDDSDAGKESRKKVMHGLGLDKIEELRQRLDCREGLLIDFDYGATLSGEKPASNKETSSGEKQGSIFDSTRRHVDILSGEEAASNKETEQHIKQSGARTGTPPFIAIELLLLGIPHRVAHDLESLFYVLLFTCTHLGGAHNTVGNPPLYGGATGCDHLSPIKLWLCSNNLRALGAMKYGDMFGFFKPFVLQNISSYFKPLRRHFEAMWKVMLPKQFSDPLDGLQAVHSDVTCLDVIQVFKDALLDEFLISKAEQASKTIGKKRAFPGDLETGPNGWDVVRPNKKVLTADPKTKPPVVRAGRAAKKGQGR